MELIAQIQLKDPGFNKSLNEGHAAALQLGTDGVQLCIVTKNDNKVQYFEKWSYEGNEPLFPGNIGDIINALPSQIPWLSGGNTDLKVFIDAPSYALVPSVFYDSSLKESYLKLQHPAKVSGEWIYQDNIESLEAMLVYSLPLSVENRIHSFFPKAVIQHLRTMWLTETVKMSQDLQSQKNTVIYAEKEKIELALFVSGKLIFSNEFSYKSYDDLIYFILLALNKNGFNPSESTFMLCGPAADQSLMLELKAFIPEITPLEIPAKYVFSSVFRKAPIHQFFPLIIALS
ncbi:MAG: DUF3822 family protein [Bacteroidota bacterium]